MKQGDRSLQANGSTYRDQRGESKVLTNRISNSSSSVTAIAGARGTGKSSLAMRVLRNCECKGAFAQLIHSPTGYNPREFLVSIFQSTTEEVIAKIDDRIATMGRRQSKKGDALGRRARTERRRLRCARYGLIVGVCILTIAVMGYSLYRLNWEWLQQIQQYSGLESEIATIQNRLRPSDDTKTPDTFTVARDIQSRVAQLDDAVYQRLKASYQDSEDILVEMIFNPTTITTITAAGDTTSHAFNTLSSLKERAENDRITLRDRHRKTQIALDWLIRTAPFAVVVLVVITCVTVLDGRIARRLRHAIKRPQEAGLRRLASECSEQLKYVTTRSMSVGAGTDITSVRARKSMASRPLSLPGVAAEFRRFLSQIATVYGKVVVCLDELDKIENTDGLERLLRAIKAVLGEPNTHFLLTVSEDALSRFVTQRQVQPGMLESAFEHIEHLESVGLGVAERAVSLMCPERGCREDTRVVHPSTVLMWLFGGAVPRDIKRRLWWCWIRI